MDEKDIRICQLLFVNSRTPIRDLADALGITVQAAHRRIQVLVDSGVIRKFTANISLSHLNILQGYFSGRSELNDPEKVIEALSSSDKSYLAIFTSGGHVLIQAFLRGMEDLEEYLGVIRNKAMIMDPVVTYGGRTQFGEGDLKLKTEGELTSTDYKIINALHYDSRRSIADISDELNISQKTIRKRLDQMMKKKLVEFSIQWEPGASVGVPSMTFVKLFKGRDKIALKRWVTEKFGSRILMVGTYLDLPDNLMFMGWATTIMQHNEMLDVLNSHEDVEKVTSHLTIQGHYFHSWRDSLLEKKAR